MFKIFWLICGMLSLIIGIIGIVLPLLPTTPFVLLAAASFAKSSTAFHDYLINSKYFGTIIKDWQENRTIPLRAKIAAVLMMSISIIVSIIYLIK
ncbi:DUF454 domain-containing protein [Desulfosporosinus fructosivorans]|uniref:DUF454 domain-containing protein n=1 Tax=Desulfosporosinus fructosivorans TaxID=2018669 RepID=A0A4Z0RCR0_9FIRM|nr:YbaN family protein [Desulfosporosinus fructosivorans]TGE40095.1 DUF454 domain-containing protein [Desulfosporosinus fructosivorans]